MRLDGCLREIKTQVQSARAKVSALSGQIAQAKQENSPLSADQLIEESRGIGETIIPQLEHEERAMDKRLSDLLRGVPNLPLTEVPNGTIESSNREVRRWGTPHDGATPPHEEIGRRLGLLDIPTAVAMSGERFSMLTGDLARLERTLGQIMIELAIENGYVEVSPPLIVRSEALFGTGQLPKFQEDLYATAIYGEDQTFTHWLIPTGEVPLTNIVAGKINAVATPLRYTALTPCFRAEAGAAGRDAAGLIRQHQFNKCELVTICRAEDAASEHDHMLDSAEQVLQAFNLPYRVMELCCGDMGFSAERSFDLEVWFPSQGCYREISSVSRCGDFQARRMNARYRAVGGMPTFLHTLNGSALAVGRCLAAILENGYTEDGVYLPPILNEVLEKDVLLWPKG